MCSICHSFHCLPGCPNAKPSKAVAYCKSCGEAITPGDEYAVIDGDAWCENCLEEMPLCQLVELLGSDWLTAGEDQIYDGYDG